MGFGSESRNSFTAPRLHHLHITPPTPLLRLTQYVTVQPYFSRTLLFTCSAQLATQESQRIVRAAPGAFSSCRSSRLTASCPHATFSTYAHNDHSCPRGSLGCARPCARLTQLFVGSGLVECKNPRIQRADTVLASEPHPGLRWQRPTWQTAIIRATSVLALVRGLSQSAMLTAAKLTPCWPG